MILPTLTAADIKSATAGVGGLMTALARVATGTASLADADTVGQDLLSTFAFVDPPAAPTIALVKFAFNLFSVALEAGVIAPDPNPIADAQTTPSSETHGLWIGGR
jgi:hypothetical protein